MFADYELSRRLERAEGLAGVAFAEAHALVDPESGACWSETGGSLCIFDGAASPVTQTFGLGMSGAVQREDLEQMERFFQVRQAGVFHEVSPMADAGIPALLSGRGYRPLEFTTILFRELSAQNPESRKACPAVRECKEGGLSSADWGRLSAAGWEQEGTFFAHLGAVAEKNPNHVGFYAEMEGAPVATGSLNLHGGVALFSGASTVPAARGRGAQQALLAHRLNYAAEHGCALAMMGALPGSASQRNAERNGFRVAYTRLKWELR